MSPHTGLGMLKSYRTIFRYDFPVAFELVDHLGRFSRMMDATLTERGTDDRHVNVDLTKREVRASFSSQHNESKVVVALTTMNCEITHHVGIPLEKLPTCDAVQVADEVFPALRENHLERLNRVGVRTFVVVNADPDNVLEAMARFIEPMSATLANAFAAPGDLAYVLEQRREEENLFLRLQLGPFRAPADVEKYLGGVDPGFEGLILDLDLSRRNFAAEDFRLVPFVEQATQTFDSILKALVPLVTQ